MRHNAQTGLENGDDDSDVRSVPEQFSIVEFVVLGEACHLANRMHSR